LVIPFSAKRTLPGLEILTSRPPASISSYSVLATRTG
jgi:hypothetical protein